MNLRQLGKAHKIIGEMMEDFLDVKAYDRATERIASGLDRTYSDEKITAMLDKKFGHT